MSSIPTFYTPSKSINQTNLIIAIVVGIIASIGLAFLYNLFSTFIPIIYFNVLITIGFGLAIGLSARLIGKFTKLINRKSKMILVGVMAISAFIFQWIAYIGTLKNGIAPGFFAYIMSIPSALFSGESWELLSNLYTYGAWSIGSIQFNQFMLLMVWLIELLIIVLLPVLSVSKSIEYPYSETHNKWYPKYTLSDQF